VPQEILQVHIIILYENLFSPEQSTLGGACLAPGNVFFCKQLTVVYMRHEKVSQAELEQ
jgi:hypothetical protein